MSQIAVSTAPQFGLPGDIADLHTARNGQISTGTSEETSAEIPFGTMTVAGTADYGVRKPTAVTNTLRGIAVRAHDFAIGLELGDAGLKPGATFGVGRKGRFFVRIEQDVTPSSDVRVRCVATGAEIAGAFRATEDSTDCIDISALARWVRTAFAAEGVGELELDMTNIDLAVADDGV